MAMEDGTINIEDMKDGTINIEDMEDGTINIEDTDSELDSECTHMMPSQRKISSVQGIDVELVCDFRIVVRKAFELSSRHVGGREAISYTKLDKDTMITNIFWADSKMISDYGHFGDVVTFDTTYKLIQGNRSLGVFLGLNHHRQTCVFGAAFMYDETTDSFAWLFNTFLNAMSCKVPRTILTDQDVAMAKALAEVMPNTNHHLCTWHLMLNAQKHIGNMSVGGKGIKSVISKLMFDIEEHDEFLQEWSLMEKEFGVENNTWLANLFRLKHVWAKAYVKNVWSASMRTTQLNKSFNSGLKQYLSRQYALPNFFKHFDTLLYDKRYTKYEAEYDLVQKMPRMKARFPILDHVRHVYTANIFELFQEQLLIACMSQYILNCNDNGNGEYVYEVALYNQKVIRRVIRTHDDHLSCSCGKFKMEGVMCSHTLQVLRDKMCVSKIPSRYVLKRWTRNAKDGRMEELIGTDVLTDPRLEMRRRHRILCRQLTEISSIVSLSHDGFNNVLMQLSNLKQIAEGSIPNPTAATKDIVQSIPILNLKGIATKDTLKGRRRRFVSVLEKTTRKKKKTNSRNLEGTEIPSHIFMSEEFDKARPSTQSQEYDNSPRAAYFGKPMTPLTNLFTSEPVMIPSAYEEPLTLKLVSQAEWQPEQLIKYEELTNARSVIVAECKRAGLAIPRPRSLEMKLADLKSDSDLSNFSDPGDDDFVIPPPRYGKKK
ncbi:protein FAR-RED IMPAIRED RESPONSE 1-like [Cornus florida]|uniref:protein FAR-RED IMPAIRED RESPONSE 1-like n=1 Tax=Cornus florida TaxID=4283 RepID=UPI00289B952B|nr:protein FAR-RED IMPAIRED RESPONSE 1-like [Cornus florida]